jgi:hypothetical protein
VTGKASGLGIAKSPESAQRSSREEKLTVEVGQFSRVQVQNSNLAKARQHDVLL